MAMKRHEWPGLDRAVYLPDAIGVTVAITPNKGNWRRGPKASKHTKTTWHDTGNPNTDADAEYRWASNGRSGAGVGGYNGVLDNNEVIIMQPFDEVVYAAGTSLGNNTSYAFEQAFGGSSDYEGSFQTACRVHAAVIEAKGWQVDTALVQHYYWYGKNCPGQVRKRGDWSRAVKLTTQYVQECAAARARDQGGTPGPVYAEPAIIPELDAISKSEGIAPFFVDGGGTRWTWVGDRVRVVKDTGRYQRASKDASFVGPMLTVGEEFDLDWVTHYEGNDWGYTPYATRIFMADVERISDTKGEQESA